MQASIGNLDFEFIQEQSYYPFGLQHAPLPAISGTQNKYQYNGIEFADDLGLNVNTAFYRTLDPTTGRWWQIDPKAEYIINLSPYCSMNNNPILNFDPLGDLVDYEDKKTKRFINKARKKDENFDQKLKIWEDDKDNTYKFAGKNEKGMEKLRNDKGIDDKDVNGFVTKDGDNMYSINFSMTKDNDNTVIGFSKFHALYEETFHLDDALGGKLFGGTNQSAFSFAEKNGVLQNNNAASTEAAAWIFAADNAPKSTTYTYRDGTKIIVENPLIQQIRSTSKLPNSQRAKTVANLLLNGYSFEGRLVNDKNVKTSGDRMPGPYNTKE